jgi:ribosomal protein S18 acetylase RimI-like enzyme
MSTKTLQVRPIDLESDDMRWVISIERQGVKNPLTEKQLVKLMRSKHHDCVVVVKQSKVVGYMIFAWSKLSYVIVSLVTARKSRREGVASAAVQYLIDKAEKGGKTLIKAEVWERRLSLQLFLQRYGFTVEDTQAGAYQKEDVYMFVRKVE